MNTFERVLYTLLFIGLFALIGIIILLVTEDALFGETEILGDGNCYDQKENRINEVTCEIKERCSTLGLLIKKCRGIGG